MIQSQREIRVRLILSSVIVLIYQRCNSEFVRTLAYNTRTSTGYRNLRRLIGVCERNVSILYSWYFVPGILYLPLEEVCDTTAVLLSQDQNHLFMTRVRTAETLHIYL